MKAVWKGTISFGLVSIPVAMYNATEPKSIAFRLLHEKCSTPLIYERFCPRCKINVLWEEVARGYQYERGKFVVLRDEDFAKIPLRTTKTIDITDIVDLKDVDPIYFQSSYILVPATGGEKAYWLLFDALKTCKKVALAKVVIKKKEHLVLLRPYNGSLLLATMWYPDEIRGIDYFPQLRQRAVLRREERGMARELVRSMAARFQPLKYRDAYREFVRELIRAKIRGREPVLPPVAEIAKAKSLMEALRASVTAAKRAKERRR